MDDDEKRIPDEHRVPETLDEPVVHEEYTAETYRATVPGDLTGFRGLSPTAIAVGGAIGLVLLLAVLLSFFHHGGSSTTTTTTALNSAAPAAPGLNGNVGATPFVPVEAAPSAKPFLFGANAKPRNGNNANPVPPPTPVPQQQLPPPPPQQRPYQPPVQAQQGAPIGAAAAGSAGFSNAGTPNGKMSLEQPPSGGAGGSQNDQAQADLAAAQSSRVIYVPVYRHGRVVSVVPVHVAGAPAVAADNGPGAIQAPQIASANQPPPASGQFVSSTEAQGVADLSIANSQRQQRYVQEQQTRGGVGYIQPSSVAQLDASTVITARLLSKIVSDLPGPVVAAVTNPVYDSATHSRVVVPAGAHLFGTYDSAVVQGQNRLLMAWQRIVFPDGREFDIGGQPGTGALGDAGFAGDVDPHRGQVYTTAFLLTVLGATEAIIAPQTSITGLTVPSIGQQARADAGAQLNQVGNRLLNQSLQRSPTIIIRPPYLFQVVVTRDLPLDEYRVR